MATVAAMVVWDANASDAVEALQRCAAIDHLALVATGDDPAPFGDHTVLGADSLWSSSAVSEALRWLKNTHADYLLWFLSASALVNQQGLKRLIDSALATRAAIVFSDYFDRDTANKIRLHPLIDHQPGSLRDDFDFGSVVLLDAAQLTRVAVPLEREVRDHAWGGWYDLRLRLSEMAPIVRLSEPTYTVPVLPSGARGESHFSYVDPRNRDYQLEMERIATAHLKRVGACLDPPHAPLTPEAGSFPVEASVVIPVRNRERTVADAVRSALSQQAPFAFNVIVVDNHSDDGTTHILSQIARRDDRLVHRVPERTDLGIGGCWNEAIYSNGCGRYAVQLDSDDLYASADVLARIVAQFQRSSCAMVIGSYTIVDFDLNPMAPGLIDHREWTDENGPNNALRIAGLGAPRAFHVPTLRGVGFPNVSFGEDYAVALRISGQHRVGRIYDSLYWCRRWEDNTDHALPLETSNRYAAYKDRLRSIEIAARQNRST